MAVSMVLACGGDDDARPRAAVVPPAAEPPRRTAAESEDMRALATDLVAGKACEEIRGSIHPLRAGGGGTGTEGGGQVTGRLWLDECRVRRLEHGIELEVTGRGWRWIDEQAKSMGATFELAQYIPFAASFEARAAVDVAYAADEHLVHLWLTPTAPIRAVIEPIGGIEVRTPGAWSSLLGWAADVLPIDSIDKRADGTVSEKGGKEVAKALRRGYSLVMDLCTGKRHAKLGILEEGDLPGKGGSKGDGKGGDGKGGGKGDGKGKDDEGEAGKREAGKHADGKPGAGEQEPRPVRGTPVRLYPKGIDMAGPYRADRGTLVAEIEVLEGPGVDARMLCREDAEKVLDAFLAGQPLPAVEPQAAVQVRAGEPTPLRVKADCELILVTQSPQPGEAVTYRVHIDKPGPDRKNKGMVPCTRGEIADRKRE